MIEVPDFLTITIGMIVFFAGAFLTRRVAFLRDYSIPEPVSGGLAAAGSVKYLSHISSCDGSIG